MPIADAAFFIGKTHTVCEDYALAPDPTANPDALFQSVWLSDGCSTSPHTDIGARLLTHTICTKTEPFAAVARAKNTKARQNQLRQFIRETVAAAAQSAAQIGVLTEALDATLLGLVLDTQSGVLHVIACGDGAVVLGYADGSRTIYRAHFNAGYPFYPVYVTEENRRRAWNAVPSNAHTLTKTRLRPDGIIETTAEFLMTDANTCSTWRVATQNLRFAAVLSDGVESFQKRGSSETSAAFSPVSYVEAVRELTAFKQFKGDFVQRRIQAFEKNCAKTGWHHNDDIAMASLFFGAA